MIRITYQVGGKRMKLHLSKSKYCNAVQCPKMLWMQLNHPELFDDSVMNQTILENGNEVGDLARGLFGDYTIVEFGEYPDMLNRTQELLNNGTANIAEASFAYQGLFCRVDILRNLGNNKFELYEVKSSTSVHDIYYHDVAFQYYVLTKLGYEVTKACLVHVNKEYSISNSSSPSSVTSSHSVFSPTKSSKSSPSSSYSSYSSYSSA